ncbi:MAG: hypothetical protein HT579_21655 [Candidatus Accumulibacter similis]|jgi:hypothetical protein|nr:MAG: hypothetical protein HT579_21655 [Candidatus Accumulibacter similis]
MSVISELAVAAVDSCDLLEYAEGETAWRTIPNWVRFMICLGAVWSAGPKDRRRIALVTTPCDSSAAGLICLGAMCRRLSLADANDQAAHFTRIESLVTERNQTVVLRRLGGRRARFVADGEQEPGMVWVRQLDSRHSTRQTITPHTAGNWTVDGEPPVGIQDGLALPKAPLYGGISGLMSLEVLKRNLSLSDSAVCLGGRSLGQAAAREMFAGTRFRVRGAESDLATLLSVHQWSPGSVSRVSYFNSRTRELDRQTRKPELVVTEGDAAFLRALEQEEFRNSDILAVVPRTLDRDALEAVGSKLASLSQWYQREEFPKVPAGMPRSVSATVIRKRN